MVFDPELFFTQAERMARAGAGEEDYRTAVSRAYYACHLIARDRLFGVDAVNWGRGWRPSHYAVTTAVRAHVPGVMDRRFNRLKRMRENADYVRDPDHPETQLLFADHDVRDWAGLANEALVTARALLPHLRSLPSA